MYKVHFCQEKNSQGPTKLSRKTKSLHSQYGTINKVSLVHTKTVVVNVPEPESPSEEPDPDINQEADSMEPDLSDFQGRSTNTWAH